MRVIPGRSHRFGDRKCRPERRNVTMYLVRHVIFPVVMLSALALSATVRAASISVHSDACLPAHLTAGLDGRNGEFDGMSQSGALLVLRNTGHTACTLPPLSALTFEGTDQQPLAVERRIPRGMYPGPVLLPVVVAPGQKVASRLHWVASDAFDAGNCVSPAYVSLVMKGRMLRVPFDHMMCAAAGDTAYFDQTPLGMVQ